jgi:predicted TIM-barrel fold metal-dependent hydrolase
LEGDLDVDLPLIISADDHVIEPAHVWQDNLPRRHRDKGPKLVRRRGRVSRPDRTWVLVEDDTEGWADCWQYEGVLFPILSTLAAVSYPPDSDKVGGPGVFEDFRPGCYQRQARLADMDANHTEASVCFPTFPRFCGQTFLEAEDRELAYACVQAYNDWMIDDWCGNEARGRLIPLTLIPLWDPPLAAQEVTRCAEKGSHAICFSESPYELGLPSVFTDHWEPLWRACEDTSTVVSVHQGSSSKFITTSEDAPPLVPVSLTHLSAEKTLVDWLASGILERYPTIKLTLSEGQAGWMPFVLERMDRTRRQWGRHGGTNASAPPSTYVSGRVYACTFDEETGLAMRHRIGMSQIMFETDYPHADSTWPHSAEVATRMITTAGLDETETRQLLRGNAIDCYGLQRYGLEP